MRNIKEGENRGKYFSSRFCRFRLRNFVATVSVGAEYAVVQPVRSFTKKGIDILPNQFAFGRDLEEASEVAFANQRVAVRQAPSVGNPRAVKFVLTPLLIFPNNFLGRQIDFNNPRKSHCMIQPVRPVVEEKQVAVCERHRRMLTGERWRAELP